MFPPWKALLAESHGCERRGVVRRCAPALAMLKRIRGIGWASRPLHDRRLWEQAPEAGWVFTVRDGDGWQKTQHHRHRPGLHEAMPRSAGGSAEAAP